MFAAGCHHCDIAPRPVAPPPAAAGSATVMRLDGTPIHVTVPPGGLPLRDALRLAAALPAGPASPDPAYLFAVLDRKEARYVIAVTAIQDSDVGRITLRPNETLILTTWQKTDLVRGLLLPSVDRATVQVSAPPSLAPTAILRWAGDMIRPKQFLEADILKFDQRIQREHDLTAQAKLLVGPNNDNTPSLQDLSVFVDKSQLPPAGATQPVVERWYQDVLLPKVVQESHRQQSRKSLVQPDLAVLAAMYADRPQGMPASINVQLLLDGQSIPLASSDRRVNLPHAFGSPIRPLVFHPSIGSLIASRLNVKSTDAVMVIHRVVDGRPTHFILSLPASQGSPFVVGAGEVPNAKRQVLSSALVFEGDLVEVAAPGRLPVVVSSSLTPLLHGVLQAPRLPTPTPHRFKFIDTIKKKCEDWKDACDPRPELTPTIGDAQLPIPAVVVPAK